MALSLAFLIGSIWIVLACIGLATRRAARWDLWDSLLGRRPLPWQARRVDWPALIELLGDGHRRAVNALALGDPRTAGNLSRAELASTRSVAESLATDLRECSVQACVLQRGRVTSRVRPADLHLRTLRLIFSLEHVLAASQGAVGRLQLRLAALRLASFSLERRAAALLRRPQRDALALAAHLSSDAMILTRVAVDERAALFEAWRASSALVRARLTASQAEPRSATLARS